MVTHPARTWQATSHPQRRVPGQQPGLYREREAARYLKDLAAVEEVAALDARLREGDVAFLGSQEETLFRGRGMAGPARMLPPSSVATWL